MTRLRLPAPPSPATLLALLLGCALVYGASASGAMTTTAGARVEVGLAAVAVFAVAAVLFTPTMRASASLAAWVGLALLALFAVWTGISLAWSIDPDGTWVQLNRAIAYVLAAAAALAVGASLPRARERLALGYLVVATVVALYALGGKAIPWFHVGGLIDLDHTAFFSRLRAPLAYWNALALFCVLAVPVALQAAAQPWPRRRQEGAAVAALVVLLTTIGLTYSRGGVAAVVIVLAVLLALGPDRLRVAAAAMAGALGALPPLVVGFTTNPLTTDQAPLHDRSKGGAIFTVALLAGLALAIVALRALERRALPAAATRLRAAGATRNRGRLRPRARALAVTAAAAVLIAGFAAAEAGLGGKVSQGFESFKTVKFERQSDPARILQTNSGNRWVWWNEALGAWSDRPLAGWGAGTFPLLHLRYRHNRLEVLQPHSVPIEWLAELGLVGAALALGGLGLLAFGGVRAVALQARRLGSGIAAGAEQRYGAALVAAVAAWLVHMWFDWDWDIPGVTLPLMLFLGVLAGQPRGAPARALQPARTWSVGARTAALALGAVLICAVAVSAVLPSLAHDRLESARAAVAANDFDTALDDARVATRLDPLGVEALLLTARVDGRTGQFADAAQALRKAVRRQPDNPAVWFGVARFQLAKGDVPALLEASRRMLELDPVGSFGRFFFYAADLGVRSATATGTPLSP